MSNLTDVIGRPGFAYPGTVTVTRVAAGTVTNGRYTPGATSTFTLSPVGVVPGGSSLKSLPEGRSADDVRTLYTTTKLIKLPIPDRVTIDGVHYEVYSVQGPWTGLDGTHYSVSVVRLSQPGDD